MNIKIVLSMLSIFASVFIQTSAQIPMHQISPKSVILCPEEVSKSGNPYFGCSLMFHSQDPLRSKNLAGEKATGSLLFVGALYADFEKAEKVGCAAVFDLKNDKLLSVLRPPAPMPFYRKNRLLERFENMGFASNFSLSPDGKWLLVGAINGGQAYMLDLFAGKWHMLTDPLMQVRDARGANNLRRTNYGTMGGFLDNDSFMILSAQLSAKSVNSRMVPGRIVLLGGIDESGVPKLSGILNPLAVDSNKFKISEREDSEDSEYWRLKGAFTNLASLRTGDNFCTTPACAAGYGRVIGPTGARSLKHIGKPISFSAKAMALSPKYNYYAGQGFRRDVEKENKKTAFIAIDIAKPKDARYKRKKWHSIMYAFNSGGSDSVRSEQARSRVYINPLENHQPIEITDIDPEYEVYKFGSINAEEGLFWLAVNSKNVNGDFLLLLDLNERRLGKRVIVKLLDAKGQNLQWSKHYSISSFKEDQLLTGSEDVIAYDPDSEALAIGRSHHGNPMDNKQAMGAVLLYDLKPSIRKLLPELEQ